MEAVRRALEVQGLDIHQFNGHNFRIGAATTAAAYGLENSWPLEAVYIHEVYPYPTEHPGGSVPGITLIDLCIVLPCLFV